MLFLLVENAKMEKLKCDLFQWFSNTVQNWDIFCNFKAQWLTDDVHISGFEPKIRILHKIQTFLVAIDDKKTVYLFLDTQKASFDTNSILDMKGFWATRAS